MATRRQLSFESLDDGVRDAEHLLAHGYERAGNWDLAQCCDHLSHALEYPIDGWPSFPFPLNFLCWLMKITVGPGLARKAIRDRGWKPGGPTDKRTIPPGGGDDGEAVARFKRAAARMQSHEGPLHDSPLYGKLSKETILELNRIHAEHHLSFLVPRDGGGGALAEKEDRGQP